MSVAVNAPEGPGVLAPEVRTQEDELVKRRHDKMTFPKVRPSRYFHCAALATAMLLSVNVAQAGPPLICHTFEIGQAKSLPWISHSWNLNGSENYDTKNLAADTLEILKPDTPVLARIHPRAAPPFHPHQDGRVRRQKLQRLSCQAFRGVGL